MNADQIIEATNYLNTNAANYSDTAVYEFLRVVEEVEPNYFVLAFRQIVDEQVQMIVRLDFIINEDGAVIPN